MDVFPISAYIDRSVALVCMYIICVQVWEYDLQLLLQEVHIEYWFVGSILIV